MSALIVSYSGIRGIYGVTLTADVAARYGAAFGKMIAARHTRRTPTILLGRDTRTSGPALLEGAMRGLARFVDLVDLGVVATPTLQHALGAFDADAALCITASHNPAQWNGMKLFLAPENVVLDGAHMKELRALADGAHENEGAREEDVPSVASVDAARTPGRHDEALRVHVERLCGYLDVEHIRAAKFRVAVDSGGGAGEEITLQLLDVLGCTAVPVHCVRESEPLVEHLGELRRVVVEQRCDLGVAQDLDADRLALVAEDGHAPGEELTLVLAVDHLLARAPSSGDSIDRVVIKNVSTSRALDDVVQRHGARLVETAVGEVNLSRAIAAERAAGRVAFGGEGNGGVIFPELHLGRDSLTGIGLVLERLATAPRAPLSAHLAATPRYYANKRKVVLGAAPDALAQLLARVEAAFARAPGAEVSRLDGLRVKFADGSWIGVRPSNTEPVVRIVAESRSQQWANESIARLEQLAVERGG